MIMERPQIATKDTDYTVFLNLKLKKSEENIRNGKVITLQELRNYINGLEEKFEANNI